MPSSPLPPSFFIATWRVSSQPGGFQELLFRQRWGVRARIKLLPLICVAIIWPRTLRQRPSERRAACSSRRMPLSKLLAKRAALAAAPATRCRAPSSLPLLRPSRCRSNPAHFVHSPPLMLRSHTHTHARARRKPAERIFSPQEIFELKRTLHTVWGFRRRASRRGRVRNVRSSQGTHEHTLSRVCV